MRSPSLKLWAVGGITGCCTGLAFFAATLILSIDGDLALPEFGIAVITPGLVAVVVAKATNSKTIVLLPVAYLTLVIPVLGPAFGAPDSSLTTALTIALLGLVGGLVWSTPVALWEFTRQQRKRPKTD